MSARVNFEAIPLDLAQRPQWLLWKFEAKEGEAKPRKVPYYASGARRTGKQGSEEDRAKLVNFETARAALDRGFSGVGFAFLPGDGLIGIDLDKVIDPESGALCKRAAEIVAACKSFTEISPSGTGLHIYVRGETKSAKDNGVGVEMFCGRQFFTVTGNVWGAAVGTVEPIRPAVLDRLHAVIAEAKASAKKPITAERKQNPDYKQGSLRSAGDSFFANVNEAAQRSPHAWVPALLPRARPFGAGYRITSRELGRDLEEDLQIDPELIWDFGEECHKSPIDLVMQWGGESKPLDAALRLCAWMGVSSESFGHRPNSGIRGAVRSESPDRQTIQIDPGHLPETLDQLAQALCRQPDLYVNAGRLVRVRRLDRMQTGSVRRDHGAPQLIEVTPPHLLEVAGRCAEFKKYDGRSESYRRCDLPKSIADSYLARSAFPEHRQLLGVVEHPIVTTDCRLLSMPGYDDRTGLLLAFEPSAIPKWSPPPQRPNQSDAASAYARIAAAFRSMPFVSDADESAAIALLIGTLLRRVLATAPLGAITAPSAGTGKSMLADGFSVVATARRAATLAMGPKPEEFEKRLGGVLLANDSNVVIDNIEWPVSSDLLCSVATQPEVRLRALGGSAMTSCSTSASFVLTGNSLVLIGDLKRRTVLVRLDARCERPEERSFESDLLDDLAAHRGALIRDALTITLAYLGAGAPHVDASPLGSFGAWDRMVRRPLLWIGRDDPLDPARELRTVDPELADAEALLNAWHSEFGSKPMLVTDVLARAADGTPMNGTPLAPQLREAVAAVCAERPTSRRLAGWLRTHRGRIVAGLKPIQRGTDGRTKSALWAVEAA